jgi:putative Ca2+/H+ antiporter (TMEM165/GDT1 family)
LDSQGAGTLGVVATTFGIVFVAELPDKTALATLVLASRLRARDVIAGAWLAFLVQTLVAVLAGAVLHLLPQKPIHIASGIGFLVFAVLALRRNESEEIQNEEETLQREQKRHRWAWVTVFLVVFAAESGDLTQLATAALVARTGSPIPVALGAVLALWTVTVLAVILGNQAGRLLTPTLLNRISAALFAVVGIAIIVSAFI